MNTQIGPIVSFPLRAKSTMSPLVVEFSSEQSGRVIIPNNYWGKGDDHDHWISCYNRAVWTILAAEPASNETQGRKAEVLGGLPPRWFIRTLNPIFSAEIQKQLFKLGWTWTSGANTIKYVEDFGLVCCPEDNNRFARFSEKGLIKYSDYTEITIEQLFSLSPAPKPIEFEIAGYKGTATAETIKVGCQEISVENYKEIRKEIEEYIKPKPYKVIDSKFKDRNTDVTLSPHGINLTSNSLGNIHFDYAEFDKLDEQISALIEK